MKILSISYSDDNGGASNAAYRIYRALADNGTDIQMLVKRKTRTDDRIMPASDFGKRNLIRDVSDFIVCKAKNKVQHYRWGKYPGRGDVVLSDLRSEPLNGALQKIGPDIIHLNWINQRFLDLRELKKMNRPVVWTLHDCWPFTGICHYFYACEAYRESCGKCPSLGSKDAKDMSYLVWEKKRQIYKDLNLNLVAPSNWMAGKARESALFRDFPITVIPYCIDHELFSPGSKTEACARWNLDPGKRYILYGAVNALNDKRKGYDLLIKSFLHFESIADKNDTELLIIGANEPIDKLQVKTKVNYLGILESESDLISAYRCADVTVVPSIAENLSLLTMESMSCGVSVVAFDIGGNRDLIDHKFNGYLAKPYNCDDLSIGIKWCLENNADQHLSKNARTKIVDSFNYEMTADAYNKLYRRIVHNEYSQPCSLSIN